MTDRRDNSTEKRDFGDIPIQREVNSLPAETGPRKNNSRRSPLHRHAVKPPKRTFSFLALLCITVVLFILYLAGALYLVPIVIKGPAAELLSQQLNRPVSVDKVSFSPFTFRLHLVGCTIGPEPKRRDDPILCRVRSIDVRLQPTSLFRGRLAVEKLNIDQLAANLVRYRDGTYTGLSARSGKAGGHNTGRLNILPPWLLFRNIQLSDGTLIFHDLPTGRQLSISRIQFRLTDADRSKAAPEPTLRAMINSSPIVLRGQRHFTPDGRVETRLSLQLKNIDLQQCLPYLSGSVNSLRVTSGSADTTLEINFQDKPLSAEGPVVTGSVSIADLVLQAADGSLQLKVPVTQMNFRAQPLKSLYTIKEMVLNSPRILLPDSNPAWFIELQTRIASLLNPAGISLEVDHLAVNNGAVITGDHEQWQNLHILLAGFHSKAAARLPGIKNTPSASLNFQADRGKATIQFQGETDPSINLSGKISFQEMDTDLLQQFQPAGTETQFTKGKISIAGELLAKRGKKGQGNWTITDSSLQIDNFSLLQRNNLLVSGKKMSSTGCTIHINKHSISCQQLSFNHADFAAGATLLLPVNRQKKTDRPLLFSYNNLTIRDSTAVIPLLQTDKSSKELQINLLGLNLQLTDMEQKQPGQDNLILQAALAKQGKVELSGSMQSNGRAILQLTAENVDIGPLSSLFTDWLKPRVQQGTLHLKGKLMLPDNLFTGSFQLDDFAAENKNGVGLRWLQAMGKGVTIKLTPFSAVIRSISLQRPFLHLSSDEANLPAGLFTLLRKKEGNSVLPPVSLEQCMIENGRLLRKGAPSAVYLPEFSEINGTISPLQPAMLSSFNLSGKMDTADFTLTGRTGIPTVNTFELEVTQFRLKPLEALFADPFKIDALNSRANWSISPSSPGSGWIRLTGLTPLPGSDFSLMLALLTDATDSFRLPLPAAADTDPAGLISGTVAEQLLLLRLQSVISPRLIITRFLPELDLPRKIAFLPGETVPDFMAVLADYATLLELRPHLNLVLQGHMNKKTDGQYLQQILQEAADAKTELENLRREQSRTKLLDDEKLQPAPLADQGDDAQQNGLQEIEQRTDLQLIQHKKIRLPAHILQNLAMQRAEVIRSYLINDLMIPEDKIELQEGGAKGAQVDLMLKARW